MKSHIGKPGTEEYLCGETSLTAMAGDTCARCQRRVSKAFDLLEEAVNTLSNSSEGGPDEVDLCSRINRFLGRT